MRAFLAAFCRDWTGYAFAAFYGVVFLTYAATGAYILIRDAQVICQ